MRVSLNVKCSFPRGSLFPRVQQGRLLGASLLTYLPWVPLAPLSYLASRSFPGLRWGSFVVSAVPLEYPSQPAPHRHTDRIFHPGKMSLCVPCSDRARLVPHFAENALRRPHLRSPSNEGDLEDDASLSLAQFTAQSFTELGPFTGGKRPTGGAAAASGPPKPWAAAG